MQGRIDNSGAQNIAFGHQNNALGYAEHCAQHVGYGQLFADRDVLRLLRRQGRDLVECKRASDRQIGAYIQWCRGPGCMDASPVKSWPCFYCMAIWKIDRLFGVNLNLTALR